MKSSVTISSFCLLAACAPVTQNTPGEVFVRGDDEVIVVGPREHGKTAFPTKRMIDQAKEACSNARFIDARPSLSNPNNFDYLFKC